MSNDDGAPEHEDDSRAHLRDIDDGCGCMGVWEHLSERRERSEE